MVFRQEIQQRHTRKLGKRRYKSDRFRARFTEGHKGSFIEFDLTFSAEEEAPSEWIFEYFDGEWKAGGTYKVYGDTFGKYYQPTSVLETARFKNAVNGSLKLRMRAFERSRRQDYRKVTGLQVPGGVPHICYGKPFGQSPADCGIEPEIAAYLRSVAERIVLK